MRKGPSLYYASDKNIFDALNQSKVDQETIQAMFHRRNIVCSKQTKREDLASFFSRLTHDSLDHDDLSRRLGIVKRQERVTAMDLRGQVSDESIARAVEQVRQKLIQTGDTVHVTSSGSSVTLNVRYTEINYRHSEFSQLQRREGYIEIFREGGDLIVRSTQAEHPEEVRHELIRAIEADANIALERSEISLFHHGLHAVRSQFFYDLVTTLPGYVRRDVTDVFVYKPKPSGMTPPDDGVGDTHIERVLLRGQGVSQSEILRELTQEKGYYIVKIGWIATELFGAGFGFDIEAMFADPAECRGFSYILHGVHELDDNGKLLSKRRTPTPSEIDAVARAIERRARELMRALDAQKAGGAT